MGLTITRRFVRRRNATGVTTRAQSNPLNILTVAGVSDYEIGKSKQE